MDYSQCTTVRDCCLRGSIASVRLSLNPFDYYTCHCNDIVIMDDTVFLIPLAGIFYRVEVRDREDG